MHIQAILNLKPCVSWLVNHSKYQRNICMLCFSHVCIVIVFRMPPPDLPITQDCHELWSKKRRRQIREQQEAGLHVAQGKPQTSKDRPAKQNAPFDESLEQGG